MSEQSAIQWTDATWNPITGCTKVSPGCANCYIERTPPFRMAGRRFVKGAIPVLLHPDRLDQPLRWRKPRRVFVCSLADLFHEDVPDEFVARIFATMALAREHTFQLLTKRPERMSELLADKSWIGEVYVWAQRMGSAGVDRFLRFRGQIERMAGTWPLSNVHLGVSVENQRMADERIPVLLDTPAAMHFLSCEPLLGALDLRKWLKPEDCCFERREFGECHCIWQRPALNWLICGGESGPGSAERKLVERCEGSLHNTAICGRCDGTGWRPKPQALEWVRDIQRQCVAAGVPFFFKQWPMPPGKPGGPALIDGKEWRQMPDAASERLEEK